jgi:hypothetical protein
MTADLSLLARDTFRTKDNGFPVSDEKPAVTDRRYTGRKSYNAVG